jgi:hypothetical protein
MLYQNEEPLMQEIKKLIAVEIIPFCQGGTKLMKLALKRLGVGLLMQ